MDIAIPRAQLEGSSGLFVTYPEHAAVESDRVAYDDYTNHRCSRCGAPVVNVQSALMWAAVGVDMDPKYAVPCIVEVVSTE